MQTRTLKVDLHMHSRGDPQDDLVHGPEDMIDAAAAAGLDALAISNHDCAIYCPGLASYARGKGVLLIPGIELTYDYQHILLVNFKDVSEVQSPDDIMERKRPDNLVVAAHPYYPLARSCGKLLDELPGLFDAVEYSFMYVRGINCFNKKAARRALELGLPLVASSDAHSPGRVGPNHTVVDAFDNTPEAIIEAIKAGRCRAVSRPMSYPGLFMYAAGMKAVDAFWRVRRRARRLARQVFR